MTVLDMDFLYGIRDEIKDAFENASEEWAAYIFGILVFVLAIAANSWFSEALAKVLFYITAVFLIYGLFVYLKPKLKMAWESTTGKIIFSILLFIGTTVCMATAQMVVNMSLGVTSAPFLYTQSLVALMISVVFVAAILATFGIIILFVMPLLFANETNFSLKNFLVFWKIEWGEVSQFKGLMRLISVILLVSFCFSFIFNNGSYNEEITNFSKWFAFNLESEQFTHCQIENEQRVAYISDSTIVVSEKVDDEYHFFISSCALP